MIYVFLTMSEINREAIARSTRMSAHYSLTPLLPVRMAEHALIAKEVTGTVAADAVRTLIVFHTS